MSPPKADLVIAFRIKSISKQHIRSEVGDAEHQYSSLLDVLKHGGLNAVGRRGETQGHILVFVSCPQSVINRLVKRERHSDFLYGLPIASPHTAAGLDSPISPADRLRILHAYVTSTPADGGLGILPGSPTWRFVESVLVLHDRDFDNQWCIWYRLRKPGEVGTVTPTLSLTTIREHLGDSVALYFSFLSFYTKALLFPSAIGVAFHFFGTPYSPLYSTLLLLWSVSFVEWWRVRERLIALRNGTRGSSRVEKRRAEYIPGFPWWKRELRKAASLPVILLFVAVLATLLTAIFGFEAFVTHLYTGPGRQYISFSPTILFALVVPRVLALYRSSAVRFTQWENHEHQSAYAASLTIKVFALSALVAYLGLALSAFVYVPFGEGVMNVVQVWLFIEANSSRDIQAAALNHTASNAGKNVTAGMWDMDSSSARKKLNPSRLQDEMFAYTVTNQIVNNFLEIGLPYILRAINSFRNGKRPNVPSGKKKRVVFEDEAKGVGEGEGKEEREFLEKVREEVALPEYELDEDYSEMVTQFGYVALWSTIWPLAPAMALLNNFLESRSDAFKITVHMRRPIPTRTDTIGPWLDSLSFLTWLSALTNSALVYLFRPQSPSHHYHSQIAPASDHAVGAHLHSRSTRELLTSALLIALAASHGYIVLQAAVRHLLEKAMWMSSAEVAEKEKAEQEMKASYFKSLGGDDGSSGAGGKDGIPGDGLDESERAFWGYDEGLEDIQKLGKEE